MKGLVAAGLAQPLSKLMKRCVQQSMVIHTDGTQVKLIGTSISSTHLARFRAYPGDANHSYEVYDFTTSRERAGPQKFFDGHPWLPAGRYVRRIRRQLSGLWWDDHRNRLLGAHVALLSEGA